MRLLHGVDRRHDDHQRAGVERVLDLALVGVGDAHARHRLGVRAGPPHPRRRLPVALVVLHLGPDEVVAGVGHRAVGGRIGRAEDRAAGDLAALLHLQLHRVPDLARRPAIERRAVLPGGRIERPLVDGAGRRRRPGAAVCAGGAASGKPLAPGLGLLTYGSALGAGVCGRAGACDCDCAARAATATAAETTAIDHVFVMISCLLPRNRQPVPRRILTDHRHRWGTARERPTSSARLRTT